MEVLAVHGHHFLLRASSLKCRAAQQHNMRSCRYYCRIPVAIPLVGTQWVRLFILHSASLVPSHFFSSLGLFKAALKTLTLLSLFHLEAMYS
jgi:hypothetical protein